MRILLYLFIFSSVSVQAQVGSEKKEVLTVVHKFFEALEKQDSIAFQNMFLDGARNYAVRELKDSLIVRKFASDEFRFRKGQILKERMREPVTEVKIQDRIAVVWAPYDLWVNDVFSHCGIDVFTLIKDTSGWKIASVSYTVVKEGCH